LAGITVEVFKKWGVCTVLNKPRGKNAEITPVWTISGLVLCLVHLIEPMKLSNKDLLILLGIAVAVIITLTTWVYTDQTAAKAELPTTRKTSLNQITTDMLKKVVGAKTGSVVHR